MCFGSPASVPVAPVDGADDERKASWTRKMARERVLGGGAAGCGGLLGVLITKLPSHFLKKNSFFGNKIFSQVKNVVGHIYPKFKIFYN